jgi:hypothetical protein
VVPGSFLVVFWLFASCNGCRAPTNAVCYCVLCGICCRIWCGLCCGIFGKLLVVFFFALWLLPGLFLVVCCRLWLLCSCECSLLWYILRPYEGLRRKQHLRPSECLSLKKHVRSYECLRLKQHWHACSGAERVLNSTRWPDGPRLEDPL